MATTIEVLAAWQRHSASVYSFGSRIGRGIKIGLAEMATLEQLRHDGPLTPSELGNRLAMPSGSLTALLDRLEYRQLVLRKRNPQDRRSQLVELGQEAVELGASKLAPTASTIGSLLSEFDPAERAAIQKFLDRVRIVMNEADLGD